MDVIRQKLLDREEFERGQNNFHLHFVGQPGQHMIGDIFREREIFKWCYQNDQEFRELAEEFFGDESYGFDPEKLYKAYLMMAKYTEDDWDLFK